MSRRNVLIAVFKGQESVANQVRGRLEKHWPACPVPAFSISSANRLDNDALRMADAIIVIIDDCVAQRGLLHVLTTIEQAALPALALTDDTERHTSALRFADALPLPISSSDEVLAGALAGLLHRQPNFRALSQELEVAHRFHGGLEGEIERIHEELQLAAMVQRELLPRNLPNVHGISLAALWRPTNYVSGDIYDITRLDDDHIGLFIADAVGHGVPAALMTMVISRSLVMKEYVEGAVRLVPPSTVLHRLNRDLIRRQGRSTRFATAIYAMVDCRRRVLTLAGAGHPPPILMKDDGEITTLETDGGLLGVFEDETYTQIEVDLEVGDRLVLYSDGFEQAFPRDEANHARRFLPTTRYLEEFTAMIQHDEPSGMIEQMRQRLDAERGSLHQIDDLTLICMKVGALVQHDDAVTGQAVDSPPDVRAAIQAVNKQ